MGSPRVGSNSTGVVLDLLLFSASPQLGPGQLFLPIMATSTMRFIDTLAERLRRRPAQPMGSPRVGSNPTGALLDLLLFSASPQLGPGPLFLPIMATSTMRVIDTLAERLRRRPAQPMGSPRVGSNPTGVVLDLLLFSASPQLGPGPLFLPIMATS